ncbi:MAG: hypothetical protein LAP13_13575 [Acidobacteriia bacterium]|nr:hypothetical protein [Terriglobia bacterium]
MRVLIPNLGSTSLKYQLLETRNEEVLARGKIDRIGGAESLITAWEAGSAEESRAPAHVPDHRAAIKILTERLACLSAGANQGGGIEAVGFKAVHGGPRYCGTFRVDDDLLAAMQDFAAVAPAHNPIYIQAMQIFRELLRGVPMVAVFETGFHATLPERAYAYGVPQEWREKYDIRRYGFHGASHRCKSMDTSMGFSPQSGLEQSSRAGDLDPFVVLHLMAKENLSISDVGKILCKRSGLLGISGVSNDLRDLEEAASQGQRGAAVAIEVFVYEVKKYLGAYAAALGGLDAVAFAGGIGENSWRIREQVCKGLEFLGLRLDEEVNRKPARGDYIISSPGCPVTALVVHINEELIVAREVAKLLEASPAAQ